MSEFDAFLEISGIWGEAEDKKFPGNIELISYQFGAQQQGTFGYGGGGGAGRVQFNDFTFKKRCDKASPSLFIHCAAGRHIPRATMRIRKASGEQEVFFKAEFTDVLVSGYRVDGVGQGSPIPTEAIQLNFDKLLLGYSRQMSNGVMSGFVEKFWSLKQNYGSPI